LEKYVEKCESSETDQVVDVLLKILSDKETDSKEAFQHVCSFFARLAKKYGIRPLLPPDVLIGVLSAFTTRAAEKQSIMKLPKLRRRASLDLEPDELENEVLRLISTFESSVKKWGRPSQEDLRHAVVKMASAGLSWPAAGLAAKFGMWWKYDRALLFISCFFSFMFSLSLSHSILPYSLLHLRYTSWSTTCVSLMLRGRTWNGSSCICVSQ